MAASTQTKQKQQATKQQATKQAKPELRGKAEVTRGGISPKGSQEPKGKLVNNVSTPVDKFVLGYVLGHVGITSLGTAVGAWYGWGDDWMSIAHLFWPLGISTVAASGLFVHHFNRE